MAHSTTKKLHSADYGLPPRPTTASNPVWQHLLHSQNRASTSMVGLASVAPPVGPLDKNATSMRILLHDTQSNFEKFGKDVGQLFQEIKDCKLEMKTMHSRFERDRECLTGDIIDLVNRSQKECQKSIGSPAQSQQVETLFKNVEHRLEGIDHKLDAIQLFDQTHTQALQTQIQAVQLLLDKQASIIAAISPLLPLLQAVPLHIDAVKLSLNDGLERCMTTLKTTQKRHSPPESTMTTGLTTIVKRDAKRKWPDVESPSANSTTPTSESPLHKKSRKEEISKAVAESTNKSTSTPRVSDISLSRRDSFAALPGVMLSRNPSRKTVLTTVVVSPSDPTASISSRADGGICSVAKFATPRRPLADLPTFPSSGRIMQQHRTREKSFERSNTLAAVFPSANLRGSVPAPTPDQSNRIFRVHSSFSNSFKAPDVGIDTVKNPTSTASSSGEGLHPSNLTGLPQGITIKREMTDILPVAEIRNSAPPSLDSAGFELLSTKPKSAFGRQKDRKSPMRDGRRFIPLVDSEDEDDEDDENAT